jgi:hypothetical protein
MNKAARWLKSDGQIIGRVKQSQHEQGILCSITMPWGDEFQAVVEKWDANSAKQFCELAREQVNERQASEAAKAALNSNGGGDAGSGENLTSCEVTVSAPEEAVETGLMDREVVVARIDQILNREFDITLEANNLRIERTKLAIILEVLDAHTYDEAPVQSVPREMPPVSGGQGGMGSGSCEGMLFSAGESGPSVDDSEGSSSLESLPDTETETSEDSGFHEEPDIDS